MSTPTAPCGLCTSSDPLLSLGSAESTADRGLLFVTRLFDADGFMPRWQCGAWDRWLGWLHIVADAAIFAAYTAIPISLLYLILRRRDVPLRGIFWLFAAFILSCGCTHLLDASMFYHPMYRLLGVFKVITAVVSIVTVIALVRVMPSALRMPSVLQAQESEIAVRKRAETEIRALSEKLQDRNSQLSVANRRVARALASSRMGAIRWRARSGMIDWEVGVIAALGAEGRIGGLERWADLLSTSRLATLLGASQASAREGKPLELELPITLEHGPKLTVQLTGSPERGQPDDPAIVGFVRILEER